jgi:ATP-dependent Clp protease ATP-binding subunit ClpA
VTRQRSFKNLVRARMRRTGEPYTAARAALERQAQPPRPDPSGGSSGMYPFEKFTERAKKALTLAQEEAERAHHSYIGTEHLLLGLLRERESLAAVALKNLGIELDKVRHTIEAVLGRNERIIIQQIIPTSRVKKVIEIAFEEATGMGHNYVGTEHLLLGVLVEGEGIAAHVLNDLGVTTQKARDEINRLLIAGALEQGSRPRSSPPTDDLPLSTALNRLVARAGQAARMSKADTVGLEHLLRAMSDAAGITVLERLIEDRQVQGAKEAAIAAQDYDTASRRRTEQKAVRERLEAALAEWIRELIA